MLTFDATSREVCTVKREVTSTPLQALVLLNDPQFFEASPGFLPNASSKAKTHLEDQISHGFRLATARHPKEKELEILIDLYNSQYQYFRQNRDKAYQVLSVGEKPRDKSIYSVKNCCHDHGRQHTAQPQRNLYKTLRCTATTTIMKTKTIAAGTF